MSIDPDEEYEKDLREQCKFDEYISNKLDREDRENQTGDYAPEEEVDDDKEGD
jgi:hypothetical protein